MPGRKKTSTKKKRNGDQKLKKVNTPDLETVLAEADKALESSDLETAHKLYSYASHVIRSDMEKAASPDSIKENATVLSKVLGKLGEVNVSFGDQEGGRANFIEAIDVLNTTSCDESMDDTDTTHINITNAQFYEARAILHLYLGQLNTGDEALNSYKSGIGDLEKCVKILEQMNVKNESSTEMKDEDNCVNSPSKMLVDIRQQLCGVHCSVAEIYLTDLCFEPDAEILCENALKDAMSLDTPDSPPDAVQTLANLRLSQKRASDAVSFILDSYSRMKVGCEALADLVGLGKDGKNDSELVEIEQAKELDETSLKAVNSLPGFEFRCQTAKILLECASFLKSSEHDNEMNLSDEDHCTFCAEAAIQVLGSLLAENDEVIEIWYLLGCAFSECSPPNTDAATYYWKTALDMLQKVKSQIEEGTGNEMEDESFTEQLEELNAQIDDISMKLQSTSEL